MKFFTTLSITLLAVLFAQAQVGHSAWNKLLSKHVSSSGWVSYKGFLKDSVQLNSYLEELSQNGPDKGWSENERLAYWINAYNAFTIKLIIDNYPTESIKDIKNGIPFINSVWDIKFFEIDGEEMDLNQIEHSILRKEFDEPRIHFAIVCASKSCPELRREAYTAKKLDQQLQEQAVKFINDTSKNRLDKNEVFISPIFNWFRSDFTKEVKLTEYIDRFSDTTVSPSAKVRFTDYDWTLNGE